MNFTELSKISQKLLIFNRSALRNLEVSRDVLSGNIKYWLKQKKIIGLKNGWYVLADKYRRAQDKAGYLEYIANQLVQPSYLSVEYVLAKYQILSEPVNALTSVTTKTSREIINDLAAFRFYSLSPKLFFGYKIMPCQGAPIFMAEKPKALFDFLYLRFLKGRPINERSVINLRLNWENISVADFKKARGYLKPIKSRRLSLLFSIIERQYYA